MTGRISNHKLNLIINASISNLHIPSAALRESQTCVFSATALYSTLGSLEKRVLYNVKLLDFIKLWLVDWSLKRNPFWPMDIYKL